MDMTLYGRQYRYSYCTITLRDKYVRYCSGIWWEREIQTQLAPAAAQTDICLLKRTELFPPSHDHVLLLVPLVYYYSFFIVTNNNNSSNPLSARGRSPTYYQQTAELSISERYVVSSWSDFSRDRQTWDLESLEESSLLLLLVFLQPNRSLIGSSSNRCLTVTTATACLLSWAYQPFTAGCQKSTPRLCKTCWKSGCTSLPAALPSASPLMRRNPIRVALNATICTLT